MAINRHSTRALNESAIVAIADVSDSMGMSPLIARSGHRRLENLLSGMITYALNNSVTAR